MNQGFGQAHLYLPECDHKTQAAEGIGASRFLILCLLHCVFFSNRYHVTYCQNLALFSIIET